jgi:hypothetical protein
MNNLWSWWLVLTVALVGWALLAYAVSTFQDRRRATALALVAQQLGFFYEHDGVPFQPGPPLVLLLTTGRDRGFAHVLRGTTAGMETSLFDYKYTTGTGRSSRTHKQTVAAYRLPHAIANFRLETATWRDKVGAWFGGQSIRFDNDPEFSKRYRLQGRDEVSIRQFFTPAVRMYFATLPENHWRIESSEGWIMLYESDRKVRPAAMTDFLRETSNLVAGFKGILDLPDSHIHTALTR